MDPIQPPGNQARIPRANWRIPPENDLRREVKTFLASMRKQLEDAVPGDPALPDMWQWHRATLAAVKAKDADIHAILHRVLPFLQTRLRDPLQMEALFDRFVPEQLPPTSGFQEIALRRKCNHFVRDLGVLLQGVDELIPNKLTGDIQTFHAEFVEALALQQDHTDGILNAFVLKLQGILVDPLLNPLEEYSLMGSDGNTYGLMFLTVYYHNLIADESVPAEMRDYPPMDLQAAPNFWAEDFHPLVGFLVQWLDTVEWQNGTAKPVERWKDEYDAIPDQDLSKIPTRQDVEDRRFREEMEALERVQMQAHAAFDQRYQAILNHPLQQAIADARVEFQEMQAADWARMGDLRAGFERQFEEAHRHQEILGQRAALLRARVALLKEEHDRLGDAIDQAERSIAQLNIAITEVAAAIEERKAAAFGNVLKSIMIIGACMFASWAVTMLIQGAMGAGVAGASAAGAGGMGAGAGTAGAGAGFGSAGVGAASTGVSSFGINAAAPRVLISPVAGGFKLGLIVPF